MAEYWKKMAERQEKELQELRGSLRTWERGFFWVRVVAVIGWVAVILMAVKA